MNTTLRDILRGLLAVLVLFLTAIDDLVTAVLGTGPVVPRARRLAWVIAGEYRAGRASATTIPPDLGER